MYRLLPTEEDAREEDRTASGSTFDPESSTPRRPFQSMAQKFKSIAPSFLYPGGGGNSSSSSSNPSSWRPWSTTPRAGRNNNSRSRQRTNSNTSGRTSRSQSQQQSHGFGYQPPIKKKEYKLDRLFTKRLSRLFGILLSKHSKVLWLYIGMTLFCCLNEGIVYFVGTIPSRYYKVLNDKDSPAFFRLLVVSLFTVFLAGFVSSPLSPNYISTTCLIQLNSYKHFHSNFFHA